MAKSTRGQYETHLQHFKRFCLEHHHSNVMIVPCNLAIEFLTKLYEQGKSYSTINSARSAISQFVMLSDSTCNFGSHPITNRFMKGIFKLRPPVPKYTFTWDVSLVLNYLRGLSTDNLKSLSHKLAMLLALCSGQRMQTLCSLDLQFLIMDNEKAVFHVKEVLKTTKPNKSTSISIHKYSSEPTICPLSTTQQYIAATEHLRSDRNSKLFISYQKPHENVTTQTLGRWVTDVMKASKVDMKFGAHSVRHASSSTASRNGIAISSILNTVGWSNEKTFASFYRRDIKDSTDNAMEFSTAVLSVE